MICLSRTNWQGAIMTREQKEQVENNFKQWIGKAIIHNGRHPLDNPIERYFSEVGCDVELSEVSESLSAIVEEANRALCVGMRGGARPGAGRKPKDENEKVVVVSFCCTPEQRDALHNSAVESGKSQSEYIVGKLFG